MARTPQAEWFGSVERPLAGYVHRPVQPAGTGVLICPPFGYELTCAHRTLRRLAELLAADGHLVLRFDYECTGASSGMASEPNLLDRWQDSVSAGVGWLREHGVTSPALVGLRMGAALACAYAATDPLVGPLVLWAPVTSGRNFYREIRALAVITPGGVPGDGALNAIGHLLPESTLKAMKSWHPLVGVDPAVPMLLVQSPGWRDREESAAELAAAGLHPQVCEIPGTAEVLETDAELAKVPTQLITVIRDWITSTHHPGESTIPAAGREAALVRSIATRDGSVTEEFVTLAAGLHGVLSTPTDVPITHGVVFLNNGVADASGPARSWVEFARTLAADGVACLRYDMTGLGESPDSWRRMRSRQNEVPRCAGHELIAASDFLRARGAFGLTAVGLCSGAQIAVRTVAYRGHIEQVFAINPPLFYLPEIGVGPWQGWFWQITAFPMSKAKFRRVILLLPERVWTLLDRFGLFPSPARYLARIADRGSRALLVFGSEGDSIEDLRVRAPSAVAKLVDTGRAAVRVIDGMDHSMFDHQHRRVVLDALRQACLPKDETNHASGQPTPTPILGA